MNFLIENETFEKLLAKWAGQRKLLVPRFFFWRAGTPEQRTINGMLRSILFQLISECPNLASLIPPSTKNIPVWTNKRLFRGLNTMLEQSLVDFKICLVIDGIDEFEGDEESQASLVSLIEDSASHPGVKVLISSRPEPYLLDAFGTYQGLRLQDLTKQDIRTYVEGKLLGETRMRQYQEKASGVVEMLVDKVCEKSEGVFLWVHLVVQDLIGGIRARDSLEMLQQRLDMLKGSLDGLFAQLLGRIHHVHRAKAADILSFLLQWNEPATLVHMAFALQPDFTSKMYRIFDSEEITDETVKWLFDQMEDLAMTLLTQTASLIEINVDKSSIASDESHFAVMPPGMLSSSLASFIRLCNHCYWFVKVTFVHRSAVDFLFNNEEAQSLLTESSLVSDSIFFANQRAWTGAARVNLLLLRNNDHVWHTNVKYEFGGNLHRNTLAQAVDGNTDRIIDAARSNRYDFKESLRHRFIEDVNEWFCADAEKIKKSILATMPFHDHPSPSAIVTYLSIVPARQIIVFYLIRRGSLEWVTQHLTKADQDYANLLYAIFMDLLVQIGLKGHFLPGVDLRGLLEHAPAFIRQLFNIGLKPNDSIFEERWLLFGCASSGLTNWGCLLYFLCEICHPLDFYNSEGLIATLQTTLYGAIMLFLDFGAHVSATLPWSKDGWIGSQTHLPGELRARLSALLVIDDFFEGTPFYQPITNRMIAAGATKWVEVDTGTGSGYVYDISEDREDATYPLVMWYKHMRHRETTRIAFEEFLRKLPPPSPSNV